MMAEIDKRMTRAPKKVGGRSPLSLTNEGEAWYLVLRGTASFIAL